MLYISKRSGKSIPAILVALVMLLTLFAPVFSGSSMAISRRQLLADKLIANQPEHKTTLNSAQLENLKVDSSLYTKSATRGVVTKLRGDLNLDDKVNTGDAVAILKFCSDLITLDDLQTKLGDANNDEKINTFDATYILQIAIGVSPQLTVDIDDGSEATPTPGEATPTPGEATPTPGETTPEPTSGIFTVTYDKGVAADAVVPAAEQVESKTVYNVNVSLPTSEYYMFLGWLSNDTNELVMPGGKFVMPAKDVTLTAQWEAFDPDNTPTGTPGNTPTNTPSEGSNFTFLFYDSFNEITVDEVHVKLTENITYNKDNIPVPEGSYLVNTGVTQSVTVSNGVATPSSMTIEVRTYADIDGERYIGIWTPTGLNNVRTDMSNNYILGQDIELTEELWVPLGWDENMLCTDEFTGIFEGNFYGVFGLNCDYFDYSTVEGQTYTTTQCVGLFGMNSGTIRNLYVEAWSDTRNSGVYGGVAVGILVGRNFGTIEYCSTFGFYGTSDLQGYIDPNLIGSAGGAGGIAGEAGVSPDGNSSVISHCSSFSMAQGYFWVGGIVGKDAGGIVESCWAQTTINGDPEIASLFGEEGIAGRIGFCMGGIAGGTMGTVTNSYALLWDSVVGYSFVGGIAGFVEGANVSSSFAAIVTDGAQINSISGESVSYTCVDSGGEASTIKNVYNLTGTSYESLPGGFDDEVWQFVHDADDSYFPDLPDLIYNSRMPYVEE